MKVRISASVPVSERGRGDAPSSLTAEPDRIVWRLEGARFLFLPLPTALFAGCAAFETIVDGRYCFDARAGIAGIGLLVHYKGWLTEHGR